VNPRTGAGDFQRVLGLPALAPGLPSDTLRNRLDNAASSSLLALAIAWRRREEWLALNVRARFSSKQYLVANAPKNNREALMRKLALALIIGFAFSGLAAAAVNINTATKEELMSLKGVREKRAQEIIDYRKKNGNFKSIDDLEKVPGIGPGLMKQIRSQVTVTGTTSTDKPATAGKSKSVPAKTGNTPKAAAIKSDKANEKFPEKLKADEKEKAKK
jgi:comEA protein